MKLKHINLVERYVERVVLGLAAVFTLGVIWLFVMGGPYNVTIKGASDQGSVSPGAIEEYIADKAQNLKSAINAGRSPLPPLTVQAYTQSFVHRVLYRSVIGVSAFDLPFGQPGLDKDRFNFVEKPPPHYYVPAPGAPKLVKAHGDHFVLDETKIPELQVAKAYEALIGAQLPRDFRAVTVSAIYDMDALSRAYMSALPDQRIPLGWWQPCLAFGDVILERETLNPATNQWGDDITLQPLPDDSFNFRNTLPDLSPSAANRMIETIRLDQEFLARPKFAPVTGDRPWYAPGAQERASDADHHPRHAREISSAGGASNILIWAHDVTVRPGMTYRYRMSVCMRNPLFRNPHLDNEQYQAYFNSLLLPPSVPSAWTAPITIDQEDYFFVVGANPGRRTAEVEVWRIFNGAWRYVPFNVQPGDMIGKMQKMSVGNASYDVNFRVNNKLVVDIDFFAPATRSGGGTTTGLIVLDDATGAVQTKTAEIDSEDLTRSRLKAESAPPAVAER